MIPGWESQRLFVRTSPGGLPSENRLSFLIAQGWHHPELALSQKEKQMERGRGWENENKAETFMIYLRTYIVSLLCLPMKEMQKMQVWSLGWEDALEEEMATHSSILAWKNSMDRGAWWATVHGFAKSWTWLSTQHDFLPYSVGWHSRDLTSLTQKRDSHIVKKTIWGGMWKWKLLSRIQLFGTPWTIQSVEFSRPEYWSG